MGLVLETLSSCIQNLPAPGHISPPDPPHHPSPRRLVEDNEASPSSRDPSPVLDKAFILDESRRRK